MYAFKFDVGLSIALQALIEQIKSSLVYSDKFLVSLLKKYFMSSAF